MSEGNLGEMEVRGWDAFCLPYLLEGKGNERGRKGGVRREEGGERRERRWWWVEMRDWITC